MKFNLFKKQRTSFLGIDIGTTGVRIVQLGKKENEIVLENYASIETKDYLEILGDKESLNNVKISNSKLARDLKEVIKASGMASKEVAMSTPVSSAFSSIIVLPDMPKSEIKKAVNFEARQYIPIPIDEVVFDWSIIGEEVQKKDINITDNSGQVKKMKILLVAIPKEITGKYMNIATVLNLKLVALETESFSLARSLVDNSKKCAIVVDIANRTTNITIVENSVVVGSHTVLGVGGEEFTKSISHGFNIDFKRAESLKIDIGFGQGKNSEKKISEIILPLISIVISEIKKLNESHFRTNGKNVKKVILTGRTAGLVGLVNYFSKELDIPVEIGNPWRNIKNNSSLDKILIKNSSYFSVAVGLALRGFEDSK